jgi:N-acetyl-anhydromuramyl-L-alanine amidase AmpD
LVDKSSIEFDIIDSNLEYLSIPTKNGSVNSIIVDSCLRSTATIEELDLECKKNGQPVFTHQYYIDKEGNIFKGRKEEYSAYISEKFCHNCFGIMLEGDFNCEEISDIQFNTLIKVIEWLRSRYQFIRNNVFTRNEIDGKNSLQSPGMLFPFVKFKNRLLSNYTTELSTVRNIFNSGNIYEFGSRYLEYKIPKMEGEDVYRLKWCLNQLGFLDDEFLEDLNKAIVYDKDLVPYVRKFKTTYGLLDNDVVDSDTFAILRRMVNVAIYDRDKMYQKYLRIQTPEMYGFDVKLLKEKLYLLGFYKGIIDNIYNDEMADAVTAFELKYGILQDGEVGPLTFIEILNCEEITFIRVLELKDPMYEGSDVEVIQKQLQKKGYSITITGYYDINTKNAVMQFQIDNNLLVDGKVDEEVFNLVMKD